MQTKPKAFTRGSDDTMFKTIIVNEDDPRFLEAILKACLKEPVKIEKFYLTELPVSNDEERTKTVDVLVTTKDKYIHIEANSKFDRAVRTRNLNFFTVIYHQRTKKGEDYDIETKMVHVDINFRASKKAKARKVYGLRSEEENDLYTDNLEMITINVARIRKDWYDNVINDEDDIYLVMLDANEEELKELGKRNPLVREYGEKLMELNIKDPFNFGFKTAEEEERMLWNTRLKIAEKEASEKAMKKGMKQGLKEGIQKGIEQGIEQGIEKGEKQKQIEIAKEMLSENMELPLISKITKLSIKELENLKN